MRKSSFDRREFLSFLGVAGLGAGLLPGCQTMRPRANRSIYDNLSSLSLKPNTADELVLAPGLSYQVILSQGDILNAAGDQFGSHNDFLAFFPLNNSDSEGILWVNHEYHHPLFIHEKVIAPQDKTKKEVEREMASVGGSLNHIVRNTEGKWHLKFNSEYNRRVSGLSKIKFSNNHSIMGTNVALGTLANCAGGFTPYGTVLTCEENYDYCYGEADFSEGTRKLDMSQATYGWERFYPNPPEHYGWVVEVDPRTGAAEKLVELGRMSHECATVRTGSDGRLVVYTSDDKAGEHLYKFISNSSNSLQSGTLFVADFDAGRWIPLAVNSNQKLKEKFANQLEMLIRCREAAKIVGATPLDRPEDIEIDPATGAVFVACSNNVGANNYFGCIMKVVEQNSDALSLNFEGSKWLMGGEYSGIASPDNLAFDTQGNLWVTTDISEYAMHKAPYATFGNNGLFMVPISGQRAGIPIRVASAPIDAEFTGPLFSADGQTLFLSVQHPGSRSTSLEKLTSTWPSGSIPKSSVVAITGFGNLE